MTTTNIAEDANPFINENSSAVLNNYGRPGLPAQMTGEGLERTPYLNAVGLARRGVELPSGTVWDEPGMGHSGSTSGVIMQSAHGSSYVEIGGDYNDFINIVHRSGARVSIAGDGSVTISGGGDVVIASDGNLIELADGRKEAVYKAGYNIGVSGGKVVISSASGIDLVSGQDINISAGGAVNINSGNGIDLASSRIAITSKVDTLDLYAEGKLSVESKTQMHTRSGEGMFMQAKELSVMSAEKVRISGTEMNLMGSDAMRIQGESLNLRGGTLAATASGQIHLNSSVSAEEAEEADEALPANRTALAEPPEYVVEVNQQAEVHYSYGDISATDLHV